MLQVAAKSKGNMSGGLSRANFPLACFPADTEGVTCNGSAVITCWVGIHRANHASDW